MIKTISLFFVILITFSGCAYFQKQVKDETPPSKQETINQVFYGFPDIPIPKELEFVRDKSFIYETVSLRAGVMYLTGNVDLQSLENYFKVNMIKNGWRFVNSFKFREISMNFSKEDKTCNIKMSRSGFSSEVEIWVGPAVADRSMIERQPQGIQKGTDKN
ncbi:MAG: hypothetical protein N2745_10650 [Syntrophorhabdaceae bacterium]|nr:hypothetical protein [Syntrophorhabdaceae bacterium]